MSVLYNTVIEWSTEVIRVQNMEWKVEVFYFQKKSVFKAVAPFNNRLKAKGQNIEEETKEVIEQIKFSC